MTMYTYVLTAIRNCLHAYQTTVNNLHNSIFYRVCRLMSKFFCIYHYMLIKITATILMFIVFICKSDYTFMQYFQNCHGSSFYLTYFTITRMRSFMVRVCQTGEFRRTNIQYFHNLYPEYYLRHLLCFSNCKIVLE